jgi:hypothetical protein
VEAPALVAGSMAAEATEAAGIGNRRWLCFRQFEILEEDFGNGEKPYAASAVELL